MSINEFNAPKEKVLHHFEVFKDGNGNPFMSLTVDCEKVRNTLNEPRSIRK